MNRYAIRLLASIPLAGSLWAQDIQSARMDKVRIASDSAVVRVTHDGSPVLSYLLKKPKDSTCNSPSAGYFHPLTTPSGLVVTDVGPDDHLHHRGLFLAWLELRSKAGEGDFWGWGQHAPIADRRIVSKEASQLTATRDKASFTVRNDWLAASASLLEEALRATVSLRPDARIYDLSYRLKPTEDLVLGRHAFSGFCVRMRKDAPLTAHDPAGKVTLPAPSHLKPESDWPDRSWYAFEMALPNGKKAGVAIINHPQNPPTLWHNVTSIALLNPCIIAPGPVRIPATQPLNLRYRVVTFDGAVPAGLLTQLAGEFAKSPSPDPR